MHKKFKKMISAIAVSIVIVLTVSAMTVASADTLLEENSTQRLLEYVSNLLGFPQEDINAMYDGFENQNDFLIEVDSMLQDIIFYENWDASIKTVQSLEEISDDLGISAELLQHHIDICGKEYFMSRVLQQEVEPLASSEGSEIGYTKFKEYYNLSHTGNIYLTKDSVTVGYRHGHAGIVSSHAKDSKTIMEALGKNSDPEKEVVDRDLWLWQHKNTIAVYYPSNTTTGNRENAGRYSKTMDFANYTALVKKGEAVDVFPKVNCISLVYLSYLMGVGNSYDLVPQVGSGSLLYPSQVQFSPIIAIKTTGNGMLRTSNWNDYNWG